MVIDGTFSYSSNKFVQCLVIIALIHRIDSNGDKKTVKIPILFAFMSNRSGENYRKVYQKLKELIEGGCGSKKF
jgi:cation transport regulator ChaC